MISPDELLTYLLKAEGGAVAVDLLKIGQSAGQSGKNGQNTSPAGGAPGKFPPVKLRLALDMEDCLDRFYGGYYSDWACGGQWNRAYQFVQLLVVAFRKAQIEVIAFFDGTLRENKRWTAERIETRERTLAVLKHIRTIGTPPPKVWWLPPGGLRTALRNAMRTLNVPVVQTVNDHTMEVMAYYHAESLDGILGLSPDYIIGNIRRYYSSHDLRLSYKGTLECKQLMISKFLTNFSLTPDHLPYLAALFGGYTVIMEPTLKKIYKKLSVSYGDESETRIKRIAEIVRNSPTNDLDAFVKHLELQEWQDELKESIEYYQRKGKFSATKSSQFWKRVQIETAFAKDKVDKEGGGGGGAKKEKEAKKTAIVADVVSLASETNENDEMARKILLDVNNLVDEGDMDGIPLDVDEPSTSTAAVEPAVPAVKGTPSATGTGPKKGKGKNNKNSTNFVYTLPSEILKTALLRHQRGMMDARIFHLFNKKEIILPQVLEDEQYREVPSVHLFYRPARQQIYAILFNLFHQRYMYSKTAKDQQKGGSRKENAGKPEILIKEWIWSPQNEYARPELVAADQLLWSVSTIQRLWFGMSVEDKQRRMKAFLTVMRSDTPLMMNRSCVPQHMLVLACILRYIVTNPERSVLTHSELDAFLATALSPCLNNVEYTQDMVLPGVNLRGVYLATILMQGFETASLANDACGVPLPWLSTSPWLVFDGKLFQLKLKMTGVVQSLHELCDDHLETVLTIERLKKAILEDAEHFLLPDPMAFRNNYNLGVGSGVGASGGFNGIPLSLLQSVAGNSGGLAGAGPAAASYYNSPYGNGQMRGGGPAPVGPAGFPYKNQFNQNNQKQNNNRSNPNNRNQPGMNPLMRPGMPGMGGVQPKGHQLKVGGVVVGSWGASGYGRAPPEMANLSTRYNQVGRGRNTAIATQMLSNRLDRMSLDVLPQLAQYPPQGYEDALARAAFNMRGLGGLGGMGGHGGGYGMGGALGKQMKAGVGARRMKNNNKQANLKATGNQKKKNKTKKDGKGKTVTDKKKDGVDALGEKMSKNLTIAEEDESAEDEDEMKNGSSRLGSDLAAEMCDGVLKDDDDDEDDEPVALPKHVLTKKKLIAIGGAGSQEASGKRENGANKNNSKAEVGQGDTPVLKFF